MAVEVMASRRRFTRADYYRMAEVGILGRHDRVELIKGEIIEMSPIGRRQSAFVTNLNRLLVVRLAGRALVSVQGPVARSGPMATAMSLPSPARRPSSFRPFPTSS
jgi:hypothetical protein